MGASTNTKDSNVTGLAYAEETLGSPGVVSGGATWYPLEPNSYSDFGGNIKNVKREPINASRQKRKGVVTAIDANAGFSHDFTSKTLYRLMKGFMFAAWREKDNLAVSAVSGTQYTVASGGAAFTTTSILYGEGFTTAGNNGIKVPTAATGTTVSAPGLAVETPPAGATITRVGFQGASGDLVMTILGGVPTMTSTVLDFTTLGLIPGEWVFVGGDSALLAFVTTAANGFYRIKTIAAHSIVFDRWPSTPTADAGATRTLQVFIGHFIKNEATTALQVFQTYQLERQIDATDIEYVKGAGANTLSINVKMADKVTVDLGFVGLDTELLASPKAGTRATLATNEVCFNGATSSSRVQFYNDTGAASLATFVTDLKLTIDNGITVADAINNTIAGIDVTAGDFMVSGNLEAYFSSIAAVTAVKANVDASINIALVDNASNGTAQGWLFDVPLMMMGDGRLKVEKDKPIKLPFTYDAAGHATLNYTLGVHRFAYLPQLSL